MDKETLEMFAKQRDSMKLHLRITRFLLECNKLMDGIHVQEITETHLAPHIKFEVNSTCIYLNVGFTSPSEAFFRIMNQAARKHLGVDPELFEFNNTKMIFWIDKSEIV